MLPNQIIRDQLSVRGDTLNPGHLNTHWLDAQIPRLQKELYLETKPEAPSVREVEAIDYFLLQTTSCTS